MDREIKFRYLNEIDNMVFLTVWDVNPPLKKENLKEGTELMQFTGLKDKNGKEIYEGDIVKDASLIDVVVFENGSFIAVDCKKCKIIDDWDECNFEVIGNIYENPKLLKVKNDKS